MGYYLPNNVPFSTFNATLTNKPELLAEIADDKALICVVDNGFFKAIALIHSDNEISDFNQPSDRRPKSWYTMDKHHAYKASGYSS